MIRTVRNAATLTAACIAAFTVASATASRPAAAQDPTPAVGEAAPDFTLPDQDGDEVTLSAFRGKKHVLIAFYPRDNSPGCTNQMKCYQRELKKITAKDVEVLAISVDDSESHAGFAKSFGLQFTLLADTDLEVARRYGVFVQTASGGFAGRSVFLVNKEGQVRHVDRDYRVTRSLRGTDLMAAIKELGTTSKTVESALAELPQPERDGKTLLLAYVRGLLGESTPAIDALHHRLYGTRTGETPAMQEERRKAEIDRYRALFKKHDLTALDLAAVLDFADVKVFTRESATPIALGGMSTDGKALVEQLADEDVLVWARTKAPRLDGVEIVPRQLCLLLRKQDDAWKIYARADR